MLSTVAVVPEPPLLVPELATGAAAETAALRAACREAARRLAAASASWIAVGADPGGSGRWRPTPGGASSASASTSWSGWRPDAAEPVDAGVPLPLLVAGWLREGLPVTVRGELVAPDADPDACLALGAELAREATALLVVGDGAATHTEKAPGYLDERAGPFDDAVAAALAAADPAALAALDPAPAADLWAAGRAPWQVLAGATRDGAWEGELLHSTAAVRRRLPRGGVAAVRLIAVVGPTAAGKSDLAHDAGPRVRRRDRQRRRHAALPRPRRRHGQSRPPPSAPRCPTTCSTSST